MHRKLLYLANAQLPTTKANGVQISHMCAAFSQAGYDVTLAIPNRQTSQDFDQIKAYYNLPAAFSLAKIWCLDPYAWKIPWFSQSYLAYLILNLTFSISAFLRFSTFSGTIYSRSKLAACLLSWINSQVVFEAHFSSVYHWLDRLSARRFFAVVAISRSIETSWSKFHPRVTYAPDGVAQDFFITTSKATARRRLNLPPSAKLVVYTGNLQPHKGVSTFVQAAKYLPQISFYLVGGSPEFTRYLPPLPSNVTHHPSIPPPQIPLWLKAADVLVIPNSARYRHSRQDTSPLKLFEYLASGTPVIASGVPAITEITGQSLVTLFKPDDFCDLATQINRVLNQFDHKPRAKLAKSFARRYTWSRRSQKILKFITT